MRISLLIPFQPINLSKPTLTACCSLQSPIFPAAACQRISTPSTPSWTPSWCPSSPQNRFYRGLWILTSKSTSRLLAVTTTSISIGTQSIASLNHSQSKSLQVQGWIAKHGKSLKKKLTLKKGHVVRYRTATPH
jgi:hypothetical protein